MDQVEKTVGSSPSQAQSDANPFAPPLTDETPPPGVITPVGAISWLTFLSTAVSSGVSFAVCWSLGMTMTLNQSYLSILIGPGAACGACFGLFFGGYMTFLMRPVRLTMPTTAPDRASAH